MLWESNPPFSRKIQLFTLISQKTLLSRQMRWYPQRTMPNMDVINIQEKFDLFSDHWSPKRIGELNGQQILLAKIQGDFVYHKHDGEDELFMVMKGQLILELRDRTVVVNPGEFYIVPRGTEHRPTAKEETHLLLFEPLGTKHTGDVMADITVEAYD